MRPGRERVSKRILLSLLIGTGVGLGAVAAHADPYPTRPVKVIVPFSAGGPLDLVARTLSDKLSASLKQPFVMENRAGAGGNLGTDAAAKAAPDGYTLLMTLSTALTANPSLYRKLPFEPLKDFRPLSIMANSSQMMVVHPSVPVLTLGEFVAYAKREPLTYAHAGPGSGGHLAMEYFRTVAGFETVQPYRGNAPLGHRPGCRSGEGASSYRSVITMRPASSRACHFSRSAPLAGGRLRPAIRFQRSTRISAAPRPACRARSWACWARVQLALQHANVWRSFAAGSGSSRLPGARPGPPTS